MRVLIADDSQVVRERLIEMLNDFQGIDSIQQTVDVLQTIQTFRKNHPDVLILDISMPDGNGIDVLKNIQKDKSDTTIIILTNYPYAQYEKICRDLGASYFFDKSNEYENVIHVFKQLQRRQKKLTKPVPVASCGEQDTT